MARQKLTRTSLIESGAIRINPDKKGKDVGIEQLQYCERRMYQTHKSLLDFSKPPYWLAIKPLAEMSQKEQDKELGKHITRLKSNDKLL